MKKNLVYISIVLTLFLPHFAFAAINSINGLTSATQSLITPASTSTNSMHMEIVQVGTDRHRFRWDGSLWRVDQGGTGKSSFLSNSLLMGSGTNPITESGLNWDSFSNFLSVIGSGIDWGLLGSDSVGQGGDVSIFAGNSTGSDNGGALTFIAGTASGNGVFGGDATVNAGGGGNGVGSGGSLRVSAGNGGQTGGSAGRVVVFGGNAIAGNYNGGSIELQPGRKSGLGMSGHVSIIDPDSSLEAMLETSNLSVNRSFKFQNFSGTFGLLEAIQKWTGSNTFSQGANATTTVNFGEIGDVTSKMCFNTKNTEGNDISFYFVGTQMIVENNECK